MKKLLVAVAVLAFLATACGSDEQKQQEAQQAAEEQVDEKVNEIMDQLDASAAEAAQDTTDSMHAEGEMHENTEAPAH